MRLHFNSAHRGYEQLSSRQPQKQRTDYKRQEKTITPPREENTTHRKEKKRKRKSVIIIEVNLAGLGMKTLSVRVHVMFKCETWAASENELGLKCLTLGAVILSKLNLAFESISSEPRCHARAASSLTCGNVKKRKEKKKRNENYNQKNNILAGDFDSASICFARVTSRRTPHWGNCLLVRWATVREE